MTKKIHVAVIVPKYGLIGGAENFVFELTERLACHDEIVLEVFATRWQAGNSDIRFHKIPVISFPRWLEPISFAYFANKMTANKFDIVHTHDRIFTADIFTFHGIPHKTWIKKIRKKRLKLKDLAISWVEKKCMESRQLKMILPVSSIAKDELTHVYDIPLSKIRTMHPGISPHYFDNFNKDHHRQRVRGDFNFSPDDLVLLFIGMNFEIKGLDLILAAMAMLKERKMAEIKLIVVGKGNIRKYQKQGKTLGIEEDIHFTGATTEVQQYYLASDIFIMPSLYDTFGIVVLEAMLARLPVIVSDTVGAKDIIDHGTNGYILPKDPEPADVINAVLPLLDNGKRKEMGENGKKRAQEHSWDLMAEKIMAAYKTLLQPFSKESQALTEHLDKT